MQGNTPSPGPGNNNVQVFLLEQRSKSVELITLILAVLTIVVGTVGNVVLSLTIAASASLRTPMNTFVLSIALVDLMTSLLLLPLRVVVERKLLSKEEIEPTLYKVELFVRTFTDTARLFLMMFLSLERYQSIAKPLMVSKVQAKRRALVLSGVTWTASILLSTISVWYFCDTVLHEPCVDNTGSRMPNWGDLEIFVEMPLSLVSITTIAISYGLIVMILRQQRTKMSGHTKPKGNQVAPASYEKKPELSVNDLTKVTILDASKNGKGSVLKVEDGTKQVLSINITPSDIVKGSLLKAGDDVMPEISINITPSDIVKDSLLKAGDDVMPEISINITPSDIVKSSLLKAGDDVKQDVCINMTPSDIVKSSLLKAGDDALHQDSIAATASDNRNCSNDNHASVGGCLDIINERTTNVNNTDDTAINNKIHELDKVVLTLRNNSQVIIGADNSVVKKYSSNITISESYPRINNDITSDHPIIELNMPEAMVEERFKAAISPIVTHSNERLKENVEPTSETFDTVHQRPSLDFIHIAHSQPTLDGTSHLPVVVSGAPAQSTNSETVLVCECVRDNIIHKDQTLNVMENYSVASDHIWTCPQFDLASESAELTTFKLCQTSQTKVFSDDSNRPTSYEGVSKQPSSILCDTESFTNFYNLLPPPNNPLSATSKAVNNHLHSTELMQTNTHASHCYHPSNIPVDLSVPLGDLTGTIVLPNDLLRPAVEPAQTMSDKAAINELVHVTSDKAAINEPVHVTSDKAAVNELVHVTSDKVPVNELVHVTRDKAAVNELVHVTSDKVPVNELVHVTSDKAAVNELVHVTSDNVVVNETAHVTSDKVAVNERVPVTSDKVAVNELVHVTSDKVAVNELVHVTSDKVAVNELVHVTNDKVAVNKPSPVTSNKTIVTPIKLPVKDKRVEVVDMDGTVHMQVVNSSNAAPIEGAVCLMNPRNREQGKRKVELKAALKVGLLVCCFVCLWMPLPISVWIFRGTFSDSQTMRVDILAVFSALAASTAAVDPILYGLLNRQIRSALLAGVLKIRRKCRNCRK